MNLEDVIAPCINKAASTVALKESMKEYSMDKCECYDLMGCYDCDGLNNNCTGYVPLFKRKESD